MTDIHSTHQAKDETMDLTVHERDLIIEALNMQADAIDVTLDHGVRTRDIPHFCNLRDRHLDLADRFRQEQPDEGRRCVWVNYVYGERCIEQRIEDSQFCSDHTKAHVQYEADSDEATA